MVPFKFVLLYACVFILVILKFFLHNLMTLFDVYTKQKSKNTLGHKHLVDLCKFVSVSSYSNIFKNKKWLYRQLNYFNVNYHLQFFFTEITITLVHIHPNSVLHKLFLMVSCIVLTIHSCRFIVKIQATQTARRNFCNTYVICT